MDMEATLGQITALLGRYTQFRCVHRISTYKSVLGIRVRMFLGLLDPDLDPIVIWILPYSHKGVERTEKILTK
jgi:hypothetical protein